MADNKTNTRLFDFFLLSVSLVGICLASASESAQGRKLSFAVNGQFKILQVADMHYANGATTRCKNVLPSQLADCSDLNTTAFMWRVITAEKPDLIVFTGDNIFGSDVKDAVKSMNAAFAPAIASKIPWVAVLGNHDQESTLTRQELMNYIVKLPNTLSQVNPPEAAHYIDGFGNCNLKIHGVPESSLQDKSLLNLYFLDSGDYSSVQSLKGYDWIKTSQQFWYDQTSKRLQREYSEEPNPQQGTAPGLAYFHIPFPEFDNFDTKSATTGVRQEGTGSATTNSGFFTTLVARGDVKSVFVGHDHVNDFCGELKGVNLCYGGGFGYHAYGKAGWERRARVVVADLNKKGTGSWGDVKSIRTWKRLDDEHLSVIDDQVLWNSSPSGSGTRLQPNPSSSFFLGAITMADNKRTSMFNFFLLSVSMVGLCLAPVAASAQGRKLSFGVNGQFKILQVADMHYANGATTRCQNVLSSQLAHCSDLNTTAFMSRVIAAEKPDLIVFTGDNIFGSDVKDAVKSMNAAFAPAIAAKIPWVAVLGNHDQQSTLSREELMKHIVKLPNTLSKVNPPEAAHYIDGFGNNNLQIHGAAESSLHNKSVLNLYFLDSGDYSSVHNIKGYDWIKTSQQFWFDQTSKRLQREYNKEPNPQQGAAPGLAYFHIPLREFWFFNSKNAAKGVRQEETGSATINSGFFTTLVTRGDVKSVFVGHDHLNDFCGELKGLNLCYGGGFGYHAYGKAGWQRRARVVVADLNKKGTGSWGDVKSIRTWKRLDDQHLSVIDEQVLWTRSPK
ncbi:hypothetical protein HID58_022930 [Brassica napus]|uniref:Calcineurin-like phosphoesterase domain-containing protein n=1 Tax=Brassica napus TaxID=3708 RepID=A0ABQ8D1J9_BRANA|nr:hypothetical protein HID58_022930 [Brassica napus]